ncbi:MAG: proton-conducting transporter membrane subunit [Elusimicrobia bacterium]|nr:proton-conducting transporter membrane subunit [Elusimicrobiota bacterium]
MDIPHSWVQFDPLSLLFIALILIVSLPSLIYSIGYMRGRYNAATLRYGWVLSIGFILSMLLVVVSSNILLFLVAWELMSLISFFLVIFDFEKEKSVKAGIIYIVMTHIGTAFLILGFVYSYHICGSMDISSIKAVLTTAPATLKNTLFILFIIGFLTKAGAVPMHLWLPYAHPQAPSHISSIMSGIMIKMGIYGILRFVIIMLGQGPAWWGYTIIIFAIVSCLVGVIYALMEHDLKRLLAYHSVENIGIILLGIGVSMIFLNQGSGVVSVLALSAAIYHLINHAVFKSLLFLGAGSIQRATGLLNIEKLGGLIKKMPVTAVCFLIGALGISAVPPLNGFVSEWLTFQSFFIAAISSSGTNKIFFGLCTGALALTSGLAAACFVKAFGISFLAMPRSQKAAEAKEVSATMTGPMLFLSFLVVVLGLGFAPVLKYLVKISGNVLSIDVSQMTFGLTNFSLSFTPSNGSHISVPLLLAFLICVGALTYFAVIILAGKRKISFGRTWDCGYYNLGPKTEYSATGFSKPFRIAFSFFLQPYIKTKKTMDSVYHLHTQQYELFTTPVIKNYLYGNLLKAILFFAKRFRRLQAGSIHLYIAYIFIAIVGLIVFMSHF